MLVPTVKDLCKRDNAAMPSEKMHLFGEDLGWEEKVERIVGGRNCSDRVID